MSKKKVINDDTVLEKSLLIISEKGPENFTLADVAHAVGLSPATLLQRFGSKHQLLIRSAEQAIKTQKADLEALKQKKLPWDKELLRLICGIPGGMGSREEIAQSLGLLKLDMIDEELHPIARRLFENLRGRIQELLLQGQKKGEIDPSISPQTLTWELDALRHGLVIQWTLSGTDNLYEWMRKGFERYLSRIKK